jgi:hypothetical protein
MTPSVYHLGMNAPLDVARIRLDNALLLFDEFVQATIKQPDAATLRGLERRFAERLQVQPSYWSQIKSRSRQIGERLARQFELQCHKPRGWMDLPHGTPGLAVPEASGSAGPSANESLPRDADERFIVALVLSYYRRHPQRARTRLLDLLGEVLVPEPAVVVPAAPPAPALPGTKTAGASAPSTAEPDLWRRTQAGVAPLRGKR